MPDLSSLLQQAQQLQERLLETQAELAESRVEGSAGGGLVKATVTGTGDLVALEIAPEACDPTDTETLADLVMAAVRDATTRSHEIAAHQMDPFGGPGLGDDTSPGERGQLGF